MKSIVTLAAVVLFGWGAWAQDQSENATANLQLDLSCNVSQPCLNEEALGVCVEQVNVSIGEDGSGFMTVFQRYQNARGLEVVPIYRTFKQDSSILFDTKQFDGLNDTWLVVWGDKFEDTISTLNFRGAAFYDVTCSL